MPEWRQEVLTGAGRLLAVEFPQAQPSGPVLTVIIEGDGAAHDRRGLPTADPTAPERPGHDLALAWPEGPVVWVGRLCQHVRSADPACSPRDWTTHRYSAEALAATSAVIDQLKARAGAERLRLVGWSGGGVMAALLAQERSDVEGLITFAAPLDLEAWTRGLGLSALTGSLNPASRAFEADVSQVHLLGRFDNTVPPALASSAQAVAGQRAIVSIRRQRHGCCWRREIRYALDSLETRHRSSSSATTPMASAARPR